MRPATSIGWQADIQALAAGKGRPPARPLTAQERSRHQRQLRLDERAHAAARILAVMQAYRPYRRTELARLAGVDNFDVAIAHLVQQRKVDRQDDALGAVFSLPC